MYSVACTVGRLVEIRIWSPVSVEEAHRWAVDHNAVVDAVNGAYVCFVDLVEATVFPQEIVEAYVSTMKGEERLVRTATLLNESPTFGMQIQRMIREANHPERRVFRDPDALARWLGERLTPAERKRLGELLAPRSVRPPPPAG